MKRNELNQLNIHDPYEVMDIVLQRGEAAKLGVKMNKSPQAIRNWCRPPETEEEFESTGRPGPLQRLDDIIDFIVLQDGKPDRAYKIAEHVSNRVSGMFVPLDNIKLGTSDSEFLERVSSVMKETGEAIEKVRAAWCDDSPQKISHEEYREIIPELEDAMASLQLLKSWVEVQVAK